MKSMTLVAKHLYFGIDPQVLRDAASRVLSRVPEERSALAVVRLDALVEELRLPAATSRTVVEQMVADGTLKPTSRNATEFELTDRFRALASAQIVEPLPRGDAQLLIQHCADLAARFNRTAARNRYEIEALVTYGAYMTRQHDLAQLELGVTGRHRPPHARPLIGRATAQSEGTDAIRALFERQSSFIEVKFFRKTTEIPRPFSVVFRAPD
jgi:hypothetical protein